MKTYTVSIPATFCFDVQAESEEAALDLARIKLKQADPVTDYGSVDSSFSAPWIAPSKAEDNYPELEVTDVWGEDDAEC